MTDGILANSVDVAMVDGLSVPEIDGLAIGHEIAFTVLHAGAVAWSWSLTHEFTSAKAKIKHNPAGDTAWVTPDVAEEMAVSCLVTDSDGTQHQFQLLCAVDEPVASTPVYGHRLVKRHPDTVTAPVAGAGPVMFDNSVTDRPAYKTHDNVTHELGEGGFIEGLLKGTSAPASGDGFDGSMHLRTSTDPSYSGILSSKSGGTWSASASERIAMREQAPVILPLAFGLTNSLRQLTSEAAGTPHAKTKENYSGCGGGALDWTSSASVTDNGGTALVVCASPDWTDTHAARLAHVIVSGDAGKRWLETDTMQLYEQTADSWIRPTGPGWEAQVSGDVILEQFGAVGNGTTDDADAIVAANAVSVATRRPLSFERHASYGVGRELVFDAAVNWRGGRTGYDSAMLRPVGTTLLNSLVRLNAESNIIEHMTFEGRTAAGNRIVKYPLLQAGSSRSRLMNVDCQGALLDGVHCYDHDPDTNAHLNNNLVHVLYPRLRSNGVIYCGNTTQNVQAYYAGNFASAANTLVSGSCAVTEIGAIRQATRVTFSGVNLRPTDAELLNPDGSLASDVIPVRKYAPIRIGYAPLDLPATYESPGTTFAPNISDEINIVLDGDTFNVAFQATDTTAALVRDRINARSGLAGVASVSSGKLVLTGLTSGGSSTLALADVAAGSLARLGSMVAGTNTGTAGALMGIVMAVVSDTELDMLVVYGTVTGATLPFAIGVGDGWYEEDNTGQPYSGDQGNDLFVHGEYGGNAGNTFSCHGSYLHAWLNPQITGSPFWPFNLGIANFAGGGGTSLSGKIDRPYSELVGCRTSFLFHSIDGIEITGMPVDGATYGTTRTVDSAYDFSGKYVGLFDERPLGETYSSYVPAHELIQPHQRFESTRDTYILTVESGPQSDPYHFSTDSTNVVQWDLIRITGLIDDTTVISSLPVVAGNGRILTIVNSLDNSYAITFPATPSWRLLSDEVVLHPGDSLTMWSHGSGWDEKARACALDYADSTDDVLIVPATEAGWLGGWDVEYGLTRGSGGLMSSWKDALTDLTLTAVVGPELVRRGRRRFMRFSGAQYLLSSDGDLVAAQSGDDLPCSIVAHLFPKVSVSARYLAGWACSSDDTTDSVVVVGETTQGYRRNGASLSGPTLVSGVEYVLGWSYSGTAMSFYVNGVPDGTNPHAFDKTTLAAIDRFGVGVDPKQTLDYFLQGDLRRIYVSGGEVSAGEHAAIAAGWLRK